MPQESLRDALHARFPDIDLKGSVRSLHPFYRSLRESPRILLDAGAFVSDAEAFPYKTLQSAMRSLLWPAGFTPVGEGGFDYPSDREPGWSEELNGVTHDASTWYFAQKNMIWSFPIDHDLSADVDPDEPPGFVTTLPAEDERGRSLAAYDHFGDLDLQIEVVAGHSLGKLYVPLEDELTDDERDAGVVQEKAKLLMYNESLELSFSASFPEQRSASWCAVNPLNGLLYSSEFDADKLYVYHLAIQPGTGLVISALGDFELFDSSGQRLADAVPVFRVQGGCFSASGHLYLCSDHAQGGVVGFDMITGREVQRFTIDYEPFAFGFRKQELEGLTIWPLRPGQAPGIRGQIHVIMIDNAGSGDDDLYFKHFEVLVEAEQNLV